MQDMVVNDPKLSPQVLSGFPNANWKFRKSHALTSTPQWDHPGAKEIFDALYAESVHSKVFSSLRVKKPLPLEEIFEGAL